VIKLLIFAMRFPPEHVGTARYAAILASGLAERGVKVMVLAPNYAAEHPEDRELSYAVRRISRGQHRFVPLRYLVARNALKRALSEFQPDVLWATNGMAVRVAGSMKNQLQVPLIGNLNGTDMATRLPGRTPRTWIESVPQRRFYKGADRLCTISRFTYDLALSKGLDSDKIQVLYPSVEVPDDLKGKRRKASTQHPELADRRIVLTVGRLVKQKGHRNLLEAMRQVAATHPDVLHIIVGDGPEKKGLADQVEQLGLSDNVRLVGYITEEELESYYALATVFALTSHEVNFYVEGLGLVFIEAAARGLVAVGSSHGGIPEAIADGETGFLVDPHQPEEIGRKLCSLFDDDQLRVRMGAAAQRHVAERFSLTGMMDKCCDILQEVTA
jgi:glycosyltransferase involved in cell wall biosynthesis